MSFFKLFSKKTTVSVLDDTSQHHQNDDSPPRIRRSSAGIGSSDRFSPSKSYNDSETKLFEV